MTEHTTKTPRKRFRELTHRGVSAYDAILLVRYRRNPWRASRMPALNVALPNRLWHERLRLLSLLDLWRQMRA